jgi:hypothetical protein
MEKGEVAKSFEKGRIPDIVGIGKTKVVRGTCAKID